MRATRIRSVLNIPLYICFVLSIAYMMLIPPITRPWLRTACVNLGDDPASNTICTAEFRGPGVHHRFDDSPDDYEMDLDQRTRMIGGRGGSIILLRDGTEVLTEAADNENDADMFDQSSDEEKDLESQVRKQGAREETPGPDKSQDGSSKTHEASTADEAKASQEDKTKASSS